MTERLENSRCCRGGPCTTKLLESCDCSSSLDSLTLPIFSIQMPTFPAAGIDIRLLKFSTWRRYKRICTDFVTYAFLHKGDCNWLKPQ